MERPLKFRAWDNANKCWVPSGKMEEEVQINPTVRPDNTGIFEFFTVFGSDVELMQFTGLKDRNGVEIYEGDVLDYKGITTRVEWDEIRAGFVEVGRGETFSGVDYGVVEVIGNIYEHPHLLERT